MTTPIKTQCPNCQAYYKVQQTQLNKANATVHCDHCQQHFLVNKHLVVTPDFAFDTTPQPETTKTKTNGQPHLSTHSTQPAPTQTNHQNELNDVQSPLNKQLSKDLSSDTLIHDDLIYDDMDTDELEETVLEYDSLDSMDAWLTQVSQSSTKANEPSSNPSKATKGSRSSIKSSSSAPITEFSTTEQVVLSSTAANDIHATIDNTTNNAWLEELLIEQNKTEDIPQDDTDLSQLLRDMGVPLKDKDNSSEEPLKKAQVQDSFAPTSGKHSVASLLWTLGCLVLALLLFAQYVIFNLENLVKNPAYAQRLQTICSVAACSLPSADLTAFTITNPNHKSSQVEVTGTFSDVSATLNNQSAEAQLFPNVKVSVYGANDLIGEFIAAPNDYLLSKQNQLAADSGRQLLFTIPVANAQIREVTLSPLY